MDTFTAVALARDKELHDKIAAQLDQASIRYVFHPIFPMIVQPLSTIIEPGRITPISEQGQPVGEVYLMTLVRDGEPLDAAAYKLRNGVGEIPINPAPIVDALMDMYGEQGAVQIRSLYNWDVREFLRFDFNKVIFDNRRYETAADYFKRFAEVRKKGSLSAESERVLFEIEASVNKALAWAKTKAELSNQMLKSGELKRFSPFENTLFKFAEVTPIDEAMNQVATNQTALAESLPKTIESMRDSFKEIGASIAAGVKEGVEKGVQAALAVIRPQAEEAPKPVKTNKAKASVETATE